MKRFYIFSATVLFAVSAAIACTQDSGENLYKVSCAQCHGLTGEADTPAGRSFKAHSLNTPDALKMTDAEMLDLTKKGKGNMPAWEEMLTDEQLKDVIAYVRILQSSKKPADAPATETANTTAPKR